MATEVYSFSRVEKYNKCSWMYHLFYDKVVPQVVKDTDATVAGTIIHATLENYERKRMQGPEFAPPVLSQLDMEWHKKLEELLGDSWPSMFTRLAALRDKYRTLLDRASAKYKGSDAIRTASGGVSKSPHKTDAWAAAVKQMGLQEDTDDIDMLAGMVQADPWSGVSLVATFNLTYELLDEYAYPALGTVKHLEVQLSNMKKLENLVVLPTTGRFLNCKIDVVTSLPDGRLAIADHKTGKDEYTPTKVLHHDQLLSYGWAYGDAFGEYPQAIAINSLRGKNFVVAPFRMDLAEKAIARLEQGIRGIEAEIYIQQSPTAYGNACWNEYAKLPCPYLRHCHPEYANYVLGG